jgi:hypothetical protein
VKNATSWYGSANAERLDIFTDRQRFLNRSLASHRAGWHSRTRPTRSVRRHVQAALRDRGTRHGSGRNQLLEPQSTLFFALLVAVFGALIWWLAVTKHVLLRILAAFLAFIPAMIFGIAAVNRF